MARWLGPIWTVELKWWGCDDGQNDVARPLGGAPALATLTEGSTARGGARLHVAVGGIFR
ncbi:hypothetical protein SESBI_41211 [Sesbania bispinosa]|nr:hypothetical protein SESBI_41211 [Sesbania bispinosa]